MRYESWGNYTFWIGFSLGWDKKKIERLDVRITNYFFFLFLMFNSIKVVEMKMLLFFSHLLLYKKGNGKRVKYDSVNHGSSLGWHSSVRDEPGLTSILFVLCSEGWIISLKEKRKVFFLWVSVFIAFVAQSSDLNHIYYVIFTSLAGFKRNHDCCGLYVWISVGGFSENN